MSKRDYPVERSPSSERLIEQMQATTSLKELQDLITDKDLATLASAFDSLLQRQVSAGPSGEEASKKRKGTVGEGTKQGEVRTLSQVTIGKALSDDPEDPKAEHHWLPIVEITREDGTTQLFSMDQLSEQLRMKNCESVCVKLARLQTLANYFEEKDAEAIFGTVFGGLVAKDTAVDVLTVDADPYNAELAARCFNSFKAVTKLNLQSWTSTLDPKDFNAEFFVAAARRGIRTVEFEVTTDTATLVDCDIGPALAFGFAEPATGGVREIIGVRCEVEPDFFSLLCEKANELDGGHPIDFEVKLWGVDGDFVGFPSKYKNTDETWVIDDGEHIKNGVVVKIFRNGCDLRLEVMTSVGAEPSVD